jgi:transposase InsO family protein
VLSQPRSSQRYEQKKPDDEPQLLADIYKLVGKHPRFGYRRITEKLKQQAWIVNFKRVYRLWCQEGLKVPKKKRKKRRLGISENGCYHRKSKCPNDVWAWDFIHDRTVNGRSLKWLSIVDEFTRECVCLRVERSITSEAVIDTLADLFKHRGLPNHIRSDNGPEFIATKLQDWLGLLDVETMYIKPGSPWQNGLQKIGKTTIMSIVRTVR